MDSHVEWNGSKTLTCTDKNGLEMHLGWGGEGISPVIATLHSCGACSLIDIIDGLKNRELTHASVDLDLERSETNPKVFTKIKMVYRVGGIDLPEKLVTRLVEHSHAKYCTISNMLKHTAEITWEAIVE
ncbi:MAG: OsmC family protein [Candidatus Thalassarchaeaceae archaeon]|jgi:putative redox protein|nr:OsmC family protein [Candidatus Thalassarchaeaceae archaeon]